MAKLEQAKNTCVTARQAASNGLCSELDKIFADIRNTEVGVFRDFYSPLPFSSFGFLLRATVPVTEAISPQDMSYVSALTREWLY